MGGVSADGYPYSQRPGGAETRLADDTRVLGATRFPIQGPGAEGDVLKQGQRTWADLGPRSLEG